jgi:glycosyltransferase involved in cell wall biosynthesis
MLKILFINRPKNTWVGGDYVQMEATAEALRKIGCTVDISETPLPMPAKRMFDYDIVHIFNFSMPWAKLGVWASKTKGLETVCSMIYHEGETFIDYPAQQIMFDAIDKAIFLTEGEIKRVKRHLKVDDKKCVIIENGLDSFWFEPLETDDKISPYVLTVGRIEPFKGQLAVAQACQQLGLSYLCVGEIVDENYANQIEGAGGLLVGKMFGEELKKMYKACSVYVLASQAEVMPLTVMEAGSQKKNIVMSDHCEWKIPCCEYVKHGDVAQIKEAIETSLKKTEAIELYNKVKTMTWDNVALKLIGVYESIANNKV